MATPISNLIANCSTLAIKQAITSSYGADNLPDVYISQGRANPQYKTIPNVVTFCDTVGPLIEGEPIAKCTITCEVEQYAIDDDETDKLINTAFSVFTNPINNITPQGNGSLFIYSAGSPDISDRLETDVGTYVQQLKIEVVAIASP